MSQTINTSGYSGNPMDLLYIKPKKATILLNPLTHPDHFEIYSIRFNDFQCVENLLRDICKQADRNGITLLIGKNALMYLNIFHKLQLEDRFGFTGSNTRFIRLPTDVSQKPFEVLAQKEVDSGYVTVNNEERATVYNVYNLYGEIIAQYTSKSEADIFFHLHR